MSEENTDEQKDAFDEQSIGEKRIDAQCFLNRNFEAVYGAANGGASTGIPKTFTWKNFRAVEGPPDKVIAKLASACEKRPLNNSLNTAMISTLVPKLKLYKVEVDEKNVTKSEKELIFPEYFEESAQMFRDRQGRGFGVGLSSFTFDYNGKNPAEVDSLIECQMKLSFSAMSDIFQDRGGFTFADLICKPQKKLKTGAFNDKYYRIKAAVGYHIPSDSNEIFNTKQGKEVKELLERFNRVFTLELIKHNLDFKEDGRVSLTIDYMAASDRVMADGDASNIFLGFVESGHVGKLRSEISKGSKAKKVSSSKCKNPASAKKDRERDYPRLVTLDEAYQKLTRHLLFYVKVITVHVDNLYGTEIIDGRMDTSGALIYENSLTKEESNMIVDRINKALELPEKNDRDEVLQSIANADDKTAKSYFKGDVSIFDINKNALSMDVNDGSGVRIRYFKFGHLIDEALSIMRVNPKDYKDLKFLIGSIPVRVDSGAPSGNQYNNYKLIPISELFVSFDLYVEFVLKNIILKGRKTYPLKRFIKDMFENLIANMYSPRCFEGDGDYDRSVTDKCNDSGMIKPQFGMELFTLESNGKTDPLGGARNSKAGRPLNAATIPVKNYNTNPDSKNLITYYYIYGKHPDSTGKLSRQEKEDAKRGIYHLAAGRELGFVKSIKFKKTDVKFQKEARMASDGNTSSSALVTERYNADVTMFGNNLFRPGMLIYINPDSFGIGSANVTKQANSTIKRSVGDALGIGGYYRVIKVRNKIESGKFETELECSWVSNGTGTFNDKCRIDPSKFEKDC